MHNENIPIQIYWKFYHQNMKILRWKILIFFIFLLKTSIMGSRYNRFDEAILTSIHNLCFEQK